jgi:hypothetical protein
MAIWLATGEKENGSMNAKRKYSTGPIEEVELVDDYLEKHSFRLPTNSHLKKTP